MKAQALSEVGPYGLSASGGGYSSPVATSQGTPLHQPAYAAAGSAGGRAGADAANSAAGTTQSTSSASAPGAPAYSTTNNQEQGVDEPDLAKTDGRLLVALRQNPPGLQVASVGSAPRLRGFLPLAASAGNPTGLLLIGNNAVVLGSGSSPAPQSGTPTQTQPTTEMTVADLSDPDHPVVSRSFVVQGTEVDARLISGYVELVVDSMPTLPFVTPADGSAAASAQALATNRQLITDSGPAAWLPSVTSEPSGSTSSPNCASTMHTVGASGLDTVSVVPIAPDSSQPLPAVSVMGDAATVYASTSSLYVATSPWSGVQPLPRFAGANEPVAPPTGTNPDVTDVHGFDLSDPAAPRYLGSGQVPGTLIGQYALSEYQGYLRVATTVGQASPAPGEGAAPATISDNRVTILQPQADALVAVASLGGLGGGEKIYAVRFIGPLGFVVTFRQTDPLYVVDLSNPAAPRTAGQLALTGYSSFLQPVGNGLLLGIGQAVDPNLRVTGLQVSLFDVSNPGSPTLVSKLAYPEASSTAETDPHALLYWAPSDLAMMPLEAPGGTVPQPAAGMPTDGTAPGGSPSAPFDGAVALKVASSGLSEAGRLTQPQTSSPSGGCPGCAVGAGVASSSVAISEPAIARGFPGSGIERFLVVGPTVYTVSEVGIMASDLTSFAQVAWLPYSSTGS